MAISSLHHAKSSGASLYAVLSLNVLQTLDFDKIQKLSQLGIFTIGDLLHYKPIIYAQIIMSVANREIGHDILLENYIENGSLNTPLPDLPNLSVLKIDGIDSSSEAIFNTDFNVFTIRDLSMFSPFIEAQQFLKDDSEVFNEPASAPDDLLPKIIGSTSSIARFSNYIKDEDLVLETKFSTKYADDELNIELYEIFNAKYPKLTFGLIAGFKQEWINMGTHLGEVIHSLALAPGESVNITKIDWYRRESSQRDENTTVDEKLTSNLVHTRALNEVVKTTAREHLNGNTSLEASTKNSGYGLTASGASASSSGGSASGDLNIIGLPLKIAGSFLKSVAGAIGFSAVFSKNQQSGTMTSQSNGVREIIGNLQQNINEATVQNSSNVRSLYSSVIITDQQQESENINTRNVTNYNHSHALTIQYYEVLQRYEIVNRLEKWEPIIFIPFRPIQFNIEIIKKYWFILQEPIRSTFPEKFIQYNQFINIFNSLNPEFDVNSQIVVEKVKFILSGSSSATYVSINFGSTFTAQDPHRLIAIIINQPSIASKTVLNSPAEVLINRPLQDFDTLNIKWESPFTPKSPNNYGGICNLQISLEFTLKDNNNNLISVQKNYTKSLNYLELYQSYTIPIVLSSTLESDIRNQLSSNVDFTNLDTQEELIQHFNQNKYSYTRFLLSSLESDQLTDIIESITFNLNGSKRNLTTYIHPSPIAITENYLLFSPRKLPREYRGDIIWQYIYNLNTLLTEYKKSNSNKVKDTVYLPTAGVFAEAILGRSNASEFVDSRRFWNWQDSPIPFSAPQIAAISAGNHVVSDNSDSLVPNVPASNLNIINPTGYPLPNSLTSSMMTIQNGNMFRDMSNAGNLTSILGNLASLANTTATLAGNLSGDAAANTLNGAVALGQQVAGMVNNASKMNLPSAPSNPTQKAGLLNTIEDLNKNNKQNTDYTPKEKAVLASQGLDYDSLIASSDPNWLPNSSITNKYFDYTFPGGIRTSNFIKYDSRIYLGIDNNIVSYYIDPKVSPEDRDFIIGNLDVYFNNLQLLGKYTFNILDYLNNTKYLLDFHDDSSKSEGALWTNAPCKMVGRKPSYDIHFSEINFVQYRMYFGIINKLATRISERTGISQESISTELRLSGFYGEVLHALQYELEFSIEQEVVQEAIDSQMSTQIYIKNKSTPFGKMYGFNENETKSRNLLNEQIRAILEVRKNLNIPIESHAFRPIYCARQLFKVKENLTDNELDDRSIKFDPINLALITDNQIDINSIYCTVN